MERKKKRCGNIPKERRIHGQTDTKTILSINFHIQKLSKGYKSEQVIDDKLIKMGGKNGQL